MDPRERTGIGANDDSIALMVDGKKVEIYTGYEVKLAMLQQPGAFSLNCGWSRTAHELWDLFRPGKKFELLLAGSQMMTGAIDAREIPQAKVTNINVRGRDVLAPLFDNCFEEDCAFNTDTYFKLTRAVMDKAGMKDVQLVADNSANRKIVGHIKYEAIGEREIVEQEKIDMCRAAPASTGPQRMVFESVKVKMGKTYYAFLQEHYKLVGLMLWAFGDGSLCLARPNLNQPSAFVVSRMIGSTRGTREEHSDVTVHCWKDDRTHRHSHVRIKNHFTDACKGPKKIYGEAIDDEMVADGIYKVAVYKEQNCKSLKDATYLAHRRLAEERRMGWQLSYSFPGHRQPSQFGTDGWTTYIPDTCCRVDDDELGIHGDFFVEAVTYRCGPEKTTTIDLVRKDDMKYIAEKLVGEV